MTEDEFIQALVAAKNPTQVEDAFVQLAAAQLPSAFTGSLGAKADTMEHMRQQREGLIPMTPMDSGSFFQRLLNQGGGRPIPLT